MDEEKAPFSRKKFYKRTAILTLLWCATFLNAVEEKLPAKRVNLPETSTGLKAPHRPFAPHVNVLSGSEIQVSWLPVLMSTKQSVRYELYSGDDAEYIGYDLVYVAKRLKPGNEYKFRVRACSSVACSEFSLTRACKTKPNLPHGKGLSGSRPMFGKRRIFIVLLPPLAIIMFLATLGICIVYFWRMICYYLWVYSSVPVEPSWQTKIPSSQSGEIGKMLTFMESGEQKFHLNQSEKSYIQLHDDYPAEDVQEDKEKSCHEENAEQTTFKEALNCSGEASQHNDSNRTRSSTLEEKKTKKLLDVRKRCLSESEVDHKQQPQHESVAMETPCKEPLQASQDAIVVIDNSNVFIGAREAACALNSKLRPKHIKVRLQVLAQVLEKERKVTKRFAGGSSPPANEHVWDIYRRLGYTVDLEDRRGKDEQRVDEQLHLCIYKAIIDMPPQTLILASGDGSKGKSTGATSFPDCVLAALEHGWNVEVHSWKHSLSAEWLKIAAKHKDKFKICYLDKNLHKITSTENRCKSRDRLEDGYSKTKDNRVRA